MVTILRSGNWRLSVYGREHGVPHFHIEGPGFRCSVEIETRRLIVGSAPAAIVRTAREWAESNEARLMAVWQELNS